MRQNFRALKRLLALGEPSTDQLMALLMQWRLTGGAAYARKLVRAAKRRFGQRLPPGLEAARRQFDDSDIAFDRKWIVFLPTDSALGAASLGAASIRPNRSRFVGSESPRERRKLNRRRSRHLFEEALGYNRFDWSGGMPSSPRKTAYPATAGRTIKQSDVLHALAYFDIGAVIAYDLTPSEQERLRQNGATVLQNKIVGTPSDPVGTSSSQGIQQTSKPLNPWHLKELGLVDADGERLRELASLDMSNVIVGVIDTGVDWGHKELAGSDLWFRRYDGRSKAISRLPGARRPSDHHGHGTFVTALIKDWSVPSRKPGSQLLPR